MSLPVAQQSVAEMFVPPPASTSREKLVDRDSSGNSGDEASIFAVSLNDATRDTHQVSQKSEVSHTSQKSQKSQKSQDSEVSQTTDTDRKTNSSDSSQLVSEPASSTKQQIGSAEVLSTEAPIDASAKNVSAEVVSVKNDSVRQGMTFPALSGEALSLNALTGALSSGDNSNGLNIPNKGILDAGVLESMGLSITTTEGGGATVDLRSALMSQSTLTHSGTDQATDSGEAQKQQHPRGITSTSELALNVLKHGQILTGVDSNNSKTNQMSPQSSPVAESASTNGLPGGVDSIAEWLKSTERSALEAHSVRMSSLVDLRIESSAAETHGTTGGALQVSQLSGMAVLSANIRQALKIGVNDSAIIKTVNGDQIRAAVSAEEPLVSLAPQTNKNTALDLGLAKIMGSAIAGAPTGQISDLDNGSLLSVAGAESEAALERVGYQNGIGGERLEYEKVSRSQLGAVRMIVPENLGELVRGGTSSITLKISPNSLGTAELTLRVVQDHVRGSLVVESQAAKIAVESSLDKLIERLQQEGLTLDGLDVEVADHGRRSPYDGQWSDNSQAGNMTEDRMTTRQDENSDGWRMDSPLEAKQVVSAVAIDTFA